MPIDPSIIAGIRPVNFTQPDPIDRYAKLTGLQAAMGQQDVQSLQLQKLREDMADEQATKEAFRGGGTDQEIYQRLLGVSPKSAMAYQKQMLEGQKTRAGIAKDEAAAAKSQFDVAMEKLQRGSAILSTARDQGSYDAARRQIALTFGPEAVRSMPEQFDPGFVSAKLAEGQTIAQRLEAQHREATLAETGRHNRATEASTIRGQDLTASTARRGQDISASTAREGHRVTMRGQDLTNARAVEQNDPAAVQRRAEAQAAGKELGESRATAQINLPQVTTTAERALGLVDALVGSADGKTKAHPGFKGAVGATLLPGARFVPGTDAADFQARMDELKGGQFLQAFESLKGGGQITEIEGRKATDAISRMSLAQSEREFVTAAREFQDVIRKGVARAQQKAGAPRGANPASLSDAELKRELGL